MASGWHTNGISMEFQNIISQLAEIIEKVM
jgi:hypothetical protein